MRIESYEKRYKMLSVLIEKVYNVIDTKRQILEKAKFVPNVLFKETPEVKDGKIFFFKFNYEYKLILSLFFN